MGLMLILFSNCFEIYRKNFKKVFKVSIWIILSQILSSIFSYGVAETSVSLIYFVWQRLQYLHLYFQVLFFMKKPQYQHG